MVNLLHDLIKKKPTSINNHSEKSHNILIMTPGGNI